VLGAIAILMMFAAGFRHLGNYRHDFANVYFVGGGKISHLLIIFFSGYSWP